MLALVNVVDDECTNVFEEIKMCKKHRYAVFSIKDKKKITVETVCDRSSSYDKFLTDMKVGEGECRYGLYDMEYDHHWPGVTTETKKQKMFLMASCPDTASMIEKTLYAWNFHALKGSLVGVHVYLQATNTKEASLKRIMDKIRSTDEH